MNKKINQKYLFLVTALFIGGVSSSTQYTSAFLKLIGLTSGQVSFFTSLRSLIGIISPIVWGVACDRFQTIKKPFIVCTIMTFIFYPFVPLSENIIIKGVMLAPWATIIARFAYRPLDEIFYSWSIQSHEDEYSRIKFIAALGSGLFSVLVAYLLNYFSMRISFYLTGLIGLCILILTSFMDDIKPKRNVTVLSIKDLHLSEIVKNKKVLMYTIAGTFAIVPLCSVGNYVSYLFESRNIPLTALGVYTSIKSMCRFPLIIFANKIVKRISSRNAMIVSSLIVLLGDFAYALSTNVTQIYVIATIANLAAGILFICKAMYAYEISPDSLKSTLQMIASAQSGLATMIASVLAGYLIDAYGVNTFHICSGILSGISLIIFVISIVIQDKQEAK